MTCPVCFSDKTIPVGESHYICNNPDCPGYDGKKVQFRYVLDGKIRFPYNQIFIDRKKTDFYRKPYLELTTVGIK